MVATVGSMAVTGKFAAGAILSGFSNIVGKMKQTGFESKNLKTEMGRMTGSMKAMAMAAGLTGAALLAMLVNAVMTSPILAGSLAKLRIAFMLFGNTIAKHVKPIIEWVIKGIKWLHARFKSLPDPIQSAIVKFVIIGGVILTLIPILLLFITVLKLAKVALIALGAPAIITAITGSALALAVFAVGVGILTGFIGVLILKKTGVLDFFANLGEGFRNASGPAAVLRDILTVIAGIFGGVAGMGVIDIIKGDWDFSGMKAAMDVMEEAKVRLKTGEGYDGETSTSISLPSGKGGQNIGNQSNTVNVDLNGANIEVAGGPDGAIDLMTYISEMDAQLLQIKQV